MHMANPQTKTAEFDFADVINNINFRFTKNPFHHLMKGIFYYYTLKKCSDFIADFSVVINVLYIITIF